MTLPPWSARRARAGSAAAVISFDHILILPSLLDAGATDDAVSRTRTMDENLRFGAAATRCAARTTPARGTRALHRRRRAPGPGARRLRARADRATAISRRSISPRPRSMPGVLAIFTGADLARDGIGAIPPAVLLPGRDGKQMFARVDAGARDRARPLRRRAGRDRRRRDGRAGAGRGGARSRSTSTSSPAGRDVERAVAAGAPAIWDGGAGQRLPSTGRTATRQAVEAAFASAAHVARVRLARHPASRPPRWSRAPRSAPGMPRRGATRSSPARRAWRWCGACSPSRCSRSRRARSAC